MGNAQADFSGQHGSDGRYWHEYRGYRMAPGHQVAADHYFMRALLFAVPMASVIWISAALLIRAYF